MKREKVRKIIKRENQKKKKRFDISFLYGGNRGERSDFSFGRRESDREVEMYVDINGGWSMIQSPIQYYRIRY